MHQMFDPNVVVRPFVDRAVEPQAIVFLIQVEKLAAESLAIIIHGSLDVAIT